MLTRDYSKYEDEELVLIAQSGDRECEEFLINKFENLVYAKSAMFFLNGADKEDIHQEGLFGLYKAIRDFKIESGIKFIAFASFCIKRQLISSVKNYNRNKHKPLNNYISLTKPASDDDNFSVVDLTIPTTEMPENLLFAKEYKNNIFDRLKRDLSKFEYSVLNSFLQGNSYQEIADSFGKTPKSIDNAIQRIRKKVSKEEMLAS